MRSSTLTPRDVLALRGPAPAGWHMESPHRIMIPSNTGFSLCGVSQNGTYRVKPACRLGKDPSYTVSLNYFRRLLLSHLVPVTPLGAHSCEKIGGYASHQPLATSHCSAKSFIPSTYGVRSCNPFRISTYRKKAGGGLPSRASAKAGLPSMALAKEGGSAFCLPQWIRR